MPSFLIVAFLIAIATSLRGAAAAFEALASGLSALSPGHTEPAPPVQNPPTAPSAPPAPHIGETYAAFFARTGEPVFGPDGSEISGAHVFSVGGWSPGV